MNNEIEVKPNYEKTDGKKTIADKLVAAIIIVLVLVILTCVLSLVIKIGPRDEKVENTAEKYLTAYLNYDYDTYNELIFIDEETYYTLLYSKYAENRGLTLDEYISEINKTDYFSFKFQTMDELAQNSFYSNLEEMIGEYSDWDVNVKFDSMIEYSDEQLAELKNELAASYERHEDDYLTDIETIDISQAADVNLITAAYEVVLSYDIDAADNKEYSGHHRVVVIEYDSQYKVIDNIHYNASFFDYSVFYKVVFKNVVFNDKLIIKIAVRCTIACVCVIGVVIFQKKRQKNKTSR